jgi:hypothetical protein
MGYRCGRRGSLCRLALAQRMMRTSEAQQVYAAVP